MKIVVDNKIPFIEGVLEPHAEVHYLSGVSINTEDVKDADALVIRTRTHCNAALLERSKIKIIATATIGFDHIDTAYCKENGIEWHNAPGCNSGSVMQYVAATLAHLAQTKNIELHTLTIGIVGVGHVGTKVAQLCTTLGMCVLLNDPPREEREGSSLFVPLKQIQEQADIISLHTPLQHEGKFKTYHLVDDAFIEHCEKNPYLINTCRGEVVNNNDLKKALQQPQPKLKGAIIDCWENEPQIDTELMQLCEIATPHIAGYSCNGKANGTSASVQQLSKFFGWNLNHWNVSDLPHPHPNTFTIDEASNASTNTIIQELILSTYPIQKDSDLLKSSPETFEKQRGNYPIRFEFENYSLLNKNKNKIISIKCKQLGFTIV